MYAWGGKVRDNTVDGYPREVWVTSDCVRWTRMSISNVAPWTNTPIAGVAVAATLGRAEGDIVYISGGHFSAPVDDGSPAVGADPNTFASTS